MPSPKRELVAELDERMRSRGELAQFLARFRHLVTGRLKRFKRPVVLVTFEGSMLDRLSLHFVREVWDVGDYTMVCSIRPCMQPDLIAEVEQFSASQDCQLVGFDGDCSARFPWQESAPRSCENIGHHIYRCLRGTDGLLLSSALLNEVTSVGFSTINTQLYSELYEFEHDEIARFRKPSADKNWRLLFLFQGFTAIDAVLAYLYFVSTEIELHHLPLCYLDCYNEKEQRKMIGLITRRREEILTSLDSLWAKEPTIGE